MRLQWVKVLIVFVLGHLVWGLSFALATNHLQYPQKPLRLIVPFTPGGSADVPARLLATAISTETVQQVVVDNRSGASGIMAGDITAKAPADGYTILLGSIGMLTILPNLKKLPYDPEKSFSPVSLVSTTPTIIVVNPKLGVNNLKELIALAKTRPGTISFGSSGNGSSTHLSGELFKSMAGVDLIHVPYKGAAPAVMDLLAGQILLGFDTLASLAHVKAGRLKALAISTASRSALLPDVPTVAEAAIAGYETSSWNGIVVPAGTPKPIVGRLNELIQKALVLPDVKDRMLSNGNTAKANRSEEFGAFIHFERERWGKVIREAHIQVE
ncbi:MAG: tripartite tricarboxylate transporter substrate binding protein [Betaproteobacteria bacterium]